jgi:hypothetical protein
MPNFCSFSVHGTGGIQAVPDPENRVGDQENANPDRLVFSGFQVPVSQGIIVQEQGKFGEIPAAFPFKNNF